MEEARYRSLAEYKDALEARQHPGAALTLDNDNAGSYDPQTGDLLYEDHPATVLGEALDLLGIPRDHV